MKPWEEMISQNNFVDPEFDVLPPAQDFYGANAIPESLRSNIFDHIDQALIDEAVARDTFALPITKDREGYWGEHHFCYWASGLREFKILMDCCARNGVSPERYLDFGCASGRVLRHFAVNSPETIVYGCDLNRKHVEWIAKYLPQSILIFQNHSIPVLAIPDQTLDLVSAFSVFTHIEAFETTWLMELQRILKPGGLAWVTIHSEKTWEEMADGWPLYRLLHNYGDFDTTMPRPPMDRDRLVFRGSPEASYSSQVFYRFDYIERVWGRFFEIAEIHRRLPSHQDVIVLKKSGRNI